MTGRPTEPQYLEHIRASYADLDRWQQRAETLEPPQLGSELAEDNKLFPQQPLSETARLPLMSAGEHLRAVRSMLENQQLYSMASFSLLRGALIGAAQGVWMLAPDGAAERQERGLIVALETYSQLKVYNGEVLAGTWPSAAERTKAQEQREWLEERIRLADGLRTTRSNLDLTNIVIPEALKATFKNDPKRLAAGRMLWRQMSGDAHVLVWSLAQRATFSGRPDHNGLRLATSAGSISDIAEPFYLSYRLLKNGWGLYDRRGQAP